MSDVITLDDGRTVPNTARGHVELEIIVGEQGGGQVAGHQFREGLLKIGREFVGGTLPDDLKRMTPRMCFKNAFTLATSHHNFTYCEGFALRIDMPLLIHHAWVIDQDDEVVEPTWDPLATDSYFGIAFELPDVCRIALETRHYSLMYTRQGQQLLKEMAER